jgi:excisionase family DNA binding protein
MSAEVTELNLTMVDASHPACWTVDDVAAYLRISKKTIYKWRLKDEGPPAARVGKHLRYDPADVVAWRKSLMIAA